MFYIYNQTVIHGVRGVFMGMEQDARWLQIILKIWIHHRKPRNYDDPKQQLLGHPLKLQI